MSNNVSVYIYVCVYRLDLQLSVFETLQLFKNKLFL